ncbi:MAG: GNAT family N-acetyltransferase [Anaerolineae bacterium]
MPLPFSLARATADVERSLCDFSLSFGCLPGATTYDGADVKWCYTGAARLNRVLSARFSDAETDARIDELLAYFAARRMPFSWFVGPADTPADLGPRLAAHGLHLRGNWTGMAFDLAAGKAAPPDIPDLEIRSIADRDGDQVWARTAAAGFAMPPVGAAGFFQVVDGVGDRLRHCSRRFVGYLDGSPSATSALYLTGGLAGLYYVSTVPGARGRGLATALTARALREAKAEGYLTAVLQASPAGASVYRRMGFVACSTIPIYDYHPPE